MGKSGSDFTNTRMVTNAWLGADDVSSAQSLKSSIPFKLGACRFSRCGCLRSIDSKRNNNTPLPLATIFGHTPRIIGNICRVTKNNIIAEQAKRRSVLKGLISPRALNIHNLQLLRYHSILEMTATARMSCTMQVADSAVGVALFRGRN